MAQAKKKQSTKTAKKPTCSNRATKTCQGRGSKATKKTACNAQDRNHVYIVTAMGMIAALLLCANAVMLMA